MLYPLVLVVILLGFHVHWYIKTLNANIIERYTQIEFQLKRTSNILVELDYVFSNITYPSSPLMAKQVRRLHDTWCEIRPTKRSLAAEKNIIDNTQVAIESTYVVIGDKSLCTEGSPLYQLVEKHIDLAPVFRLSRSVDVFVYGIHYSDLAGFMISSPPDIAKDADYHLIEKMRDPAWEMYRDLSPNAISLRGPMVIEHVNSGKPLLFMLMPVRSNGLSGAIALDIDTNILLGCYHSEVCPIKIQNSLENPELPDNAYFPHELIMDRFDSHLRFYYSVDWKREIGLFLKTNQNVLLVILVIYLVFTSVLFVIDVKKTQTYYKKLADYDPLTNLRNRRGFEEFWRNANHQDYVAVAVFDIDDFKQVNDTFGHDVGDKVIKYIASTIQHKTREADAAARFGGEEFVLYMTGTSPDDLRESLERVRLAICAGSPVVIEGGITVSAGAEILPASDLHSFTVIFKLADEKLYQAKTSGKNKLVT